MTGHELAIIMHDVLTKYSTTNDETPLKTVQQVQIFNDIPKAHSLSPGILVTLKNGSKFQVAVNQIKWPRDS